MYAIVLKAYHNYALVLSHLSLKPFVVHGDQVYPYLTGAILIDENTKEVKSIAPTANITTLMKLSNVRAVYLFCQAVKEFGIIVPETLEGLIKTTEGYEVIITAPSGHNMQLTVNSSTTLDATVEYVVTTFGPYL